MKKILAIILTLFFNMVTVFAQEDAVAGELSIRLVNNPNQHLATIQLELISELVWDCDHNITNLFGGTILSPAKNGWKEFYGCWESNPLYYDSTFGFGLYKVTGYVNDFYKDHFFIDYRTTNLIGNIQPPPGHSGYIDVYLDFDVYEGKFYIYNTQNEFPTNTSIWELKSWIDDIKTEFEPLKPDNFQLTTIGSNPQLSWSHSSNTGDYWTNYAVYRSVVSGCRSAAGSFSKIATLSKFTTSYTDFDLAIGGPITAYYKIVAVNGIRESEFTDTEAVCVSFLKESSSPQNFNYDLKQNYPNPFNPSTQINFSLEEDTFVTLIVFDILGREIAILINDRVSRGNHKIQFDGSSLESGIYFYELVTESFRDVKKFVLIK